MTAQDDIRTLLATFAEALNAGDAATLLSCYATDGTAMASGQQTLTGSALRQSYEQFVQAVKMDVRFTVDEVTVASDELAYGLTRSEGTQTVLSTGAKVAESNREMFVFRNESGAWKIARYIFNQAS